MEFQQTIQKNYSFFSLEQMQMAVILGRQQVFIDVPQDDSAIKNPGDLAELISNSKLSQYFLQLARELDIMEPKTPEDIYKTHLEPTRMTIFLFCKINFYAQHRSWAFGQSEGSVAKEC